MRLGTIDGQVQLNHGDRVSVVPADSSDDPKVIPFPQAEILKKFQQPPPAPPEAGPQGPPAPPSPGAAPEQAGVGVQDTTGAGGGNIGTGTAPTPGEQGFTGT